MTTTTATTTTKQIHTQSLVDEYLASFTEHQRHVMGIATEILCSSFNVAKSTGFVKWRAKRQESQQQPQQSQPQQSQPQQQPQPQQSQPQQSQPQQRQPHDSDKTTQPRPSEPEKPKKKRIVVKRKTPKQETSCDAAAPQLTLVERISKHFANESLHALDKFALPPSAKQMTVPHEAGSIYCIFTDTRLLYVGTTSDTKKNFPLAYRSVLKEAATQSTPNGDQIYGIIAPTEDNKKRIKVRDVIKKDMLPQ